MWVYKLVSVQVTPRGCGCASLRICTSASGLVLAAEGAFLLRVHLTRVSCACALHVFARVCVSMYACVCVCVCVRVCVCACCSCRPASSHRQPSSACERSPPLSQPHVLVGPVARTCHNVNFLPHLHFNARALSRTRLRARMLTPSKRKTWSEGLRMSWAQIVGLLGPISCHGSSCWSTLA